MGFRSDSRTRLEDRRHRDDGLMQKRDAKRNIWGDPDAFLSPMARGARSRQASRLSRMLANRWRT
eukprot:3291144-Prymnesium_polylepis.1